MSSLGLPPLDPNQPFGPQYIAHAALAKAAGVQLWYYAGGKPWIDLTTLSQAEIEAVFCPSSDAPLQPEPPTHESRPAGLG